MWSGPRNISTALMRSWEARGDTAVCDEPLYAHYLKRTGIPHPGAEQIINTYDTDWRKVVLGLITDMPDDKPIYYQKHMAKHYLPGMTLDWIDQLTNCFLIREPRAVIISFAKVMQEFDISETGLPQQVELFEHVKRTTGSVPVVIDTKDVLLFPGKMIRRLCEAVDVEYSPRMLRWEPSRRETDGIWAKHWYANVETSTGFAPYRKSTEPVPPHLTGMVRECEELYAMLHSQRLTP